MKQFAPRTQYHKGKLMLVGALVACAAMKHAFIDLLILARLSLLTNPDHHMTSRRINNVNTKYHRSSGPSSYRPSRYVHRFYVGPLVVLFHSLNLRLAIGDSRLAKFWEEVCTGALLQKLEGDKFVEKLIQEGYIVDSHASEAVSPQITNNLGNVSIANLKLILTERCNLRCRYCVIEGNLRHFQKTDMTQETAARAIEMFARHASDAPSGPRTVMLYGGEPVLNWPVAEYVVKTLRQLEESRAFNGPVGIVLETNGTLVTDVMAKFLAENNVVVQVSIDGPEDIHDSMRMGPDGEGSHAAAKAGYTKSRDAGCVTVISAVFGSHNAYEMARVIQYFKEELQTPTIGLDLLHLVQGQENPAAIREEDLASLYIQAWEEAKANCLYVEHIVRRLRPFVEEKMRWKDCPACGARMVVRPDGLVGVCEAFLATGDFYGDYLDSSPPLSRESPFAKWAGRCSLSMKPCLSCEAISVCGMGCGYNAYVAHGTFNEKDDKVCVTSKALLQWAIHELAFDSSIRAQVELLGCVFVCPEMKRKILLGDVPAHPDILLRFVTEFAEGE